MAAPPEVTMDDLSGKFVMNSTLSDPIDPILTLQGLSWFLRKAISLATITLTIKQYTPSSSPEDPHPKIHIDILQVASGGISTTQENRILDWTERDRSDRIFGKVKGKSQMFEGLEKFEMEGPGGEEDRKFLKGEADRDGEDGGEEGRNGWLDECKGRHVQSWVVNVDEASTGGWTAEQVWGFEEVVEGRRYHTRRVVVRKGDKVERARLVYDYKGKAEKEEEDEDIAEY